MMGPKKLSTIRQELEQALSQTGQDPTQWLEEQLRAAKGRRGVPAGEGTEVLESLRRLLETRGPAKRRSRRVSGQ
jgi:hypothetical protein